MIPILSDANICLATGVTNLCRGFNGLVIQTEQL